MSRIAEAFEDGPALIPYVVAGDPDAESTKAYVRALAAGGADVIELGLPFSEPIADGPTIQDSIARALDAGMTPTRYLDLVAGVSAEVDVPLVAMTYYNLVYQFGDGPGVEPFVAAGAEAGLAGLIVPDLPVEESDALRAACDDHGLDLIFIVAPTTDDERLSLMLEDASGFVYVQARLGTTGARADVSDRTHESLARLDGSDVPKAVGFGVSTGENAAEIVGAGADGVVAGSVFVDIIAERSSAGSRTGSDDIAEETSAGSRTQTDDVAADDDLVSDDDVADRLEAKARELKEGALAGAGSGPVEPERT